VSVVISPSGVVTCANIGDSRAIIISEKNGTWSCTPISRDHKPDDTDEFERIKKYGGRVEAYLDEYGKDFGPKRVWLKHENLPGLAMSRSFGDLCACRAGVIQTPEIKDYKLTKDDKAIFLASDGVWEFLSNKNVIDILKPYLKNGQEELGVNEVIKKSVAHWKKEDVVIDDITVVLATFSHEEDKELKTLDTDVNTQSHHDFRVRSTYNSIPNFHTSHH
jgi:serine/threonine protein phosphatase PrpC